MTRRLGVVALLLAGSPSRALAQLGWVAQLFGGSAYSFATPLRIRQAGQPDIRITARYGTRPFAAAPYYAYRFGRWTRGHGWEIEVLHHKLYLRNAPAEVQRFEISHGYNLVCVSRAQRLRGAIWRAGAGVVVAHPEVTLRGRTVPERPGLFGGAYRVAGPVAQIAVEKRVTLARVLFVAVEGKMTAAYARIPVPDGRATVPNVAAHALVGIGLGRQGE